MPVACAAAVDTSAPLRNGRHNTRVQRILTPRDLVTSLPDHRARRSEASLRARMKCHSKIDGPPGKAGRAIGYCIASLLPERHARTNANVVAAGQDATVQVVAEESFQSPVVTRLRDARADAAIQRQLVLGRRPGRADDADAHTRSEIESLTRGARPHRLQKVHVGAENLYVPAALTQIRKRQAWLDVEGLADKPNPHIDGSAHLERTAIC